MTVHDLFGSRRAGNAAAYVDEAQFADFWSLYPRRVAKAAALAAWRRLAPALRASALAALPEHVAYWEHCGRDREHIPHASSWLNGRRWEDELPGGAADAAGRDERLRRMVEGGA